MTSGDSGFMARRLGDILVDEGIITTKTLGRALEIQENSSQEKKIGKILLEMFVLTPEELDAALEKQSSPFADVEGKKKLGELLVGGGLISRKTLEKALSLQKATGRRLGEVLEDMHVVNEFELIEFLGKQCGMHVIGDFSNREFNKDLLELVPANLAFNKLVFPVSLASNQLALAINDPLDGETIEFISRLTGMLIYPVLAARSHIVSATSKNYSEYSGVTFRADVMLVEENDELATPLKEAMEEKGLRVARFTNANDAVSKMASVQPKYIVADEASCGLSPESFLDNIRDNIKGTRTCVALYMEKEGLKEELGYLKAGFHETYIKPYNPERDSLRIAFKLGKIQS